MVCVFVVLIVVAVDREAVAAKDGGRVGPITTAEGERYLLRFEGDGWFGGDARPFLWFVSAMEAGVVFPTTTNYMIDALLAALPTSSSASALPWLRVCIG